jgi:hypothetical protein
VIWTSSITRDGDLDKLDQPMAGLDQPLGRPLERAARPFARHFAGWDAELPV